MSNPESLAIVIVLCGFNRYGVWDAIRIPHTVLHTAVAIFMRIKEGGSLPFDDRPKIRQHPRMVPQQPQQVEAIAPDIRVICHH